MKFKIIGPVVMCVMLILTACNTVSENFESESKLSDVSASESNSADMKTETIDNETWYYIETESQLRSIADSDTTLAQNYIQHKDIELTSEWISIGDDEHPFTGKYNGNGYTISGIYYPIGEKNILASSDTQRVGKCLILLLFPLIRQMQTEPTMVL